jgi:hypothetical protein
MTNACDPGLDRIVVVESEHLSKSLEVQARDLFRDICFADAGSETRTVHRKDPDCSRSLRAEERGRRPLDGMDISSRVREPRQVHAAIPGSTWQDLPGTLTHLQYASFSPARARFNSIDLSLNVLNVTSSGTEVSREIAAGPRTPQCAFSRGAAVLLE